jgi:hypothetical protein
VVRATAVAGSSKHQARLPTYHIKKLLDEICLNHAYPVKHKLRDCGMMKNFMALGSLARGMEVDEVLDEGDTTPFPEEDTVITIYDGRPSPGMGRISNPSLGTLARCGWGHGNTGM